MPYRLFLLDLRTQNRSIYRSCLHSIRRKAAQPHAIAVYSIQASREAKQKAQAQIAQAVSRQPTAAEMNRHWDNIRNLQKVTASEDQDGGFSVRYFEQDENGRTELANERAFENSLNDFNGADFDATLRGTQDALQTEDEKSVFQTVLREMGGENLSSVTTIEEADKMEAKMEAYSKYIDAEFARATCDLPPDVCAELQRDMSDLALADLEEEPPPISCPQISRASWTPNQRKKILRLNESLARVFRRMQRGKPLNEKSVSAVYRAYHVARCSLPCDWSAVPTEVWNLLWTVLSADESIHVNRLSHISLLSKDMADAKVPLTGPQQLLTIEAMFVNGWESKAIKNWRRCIDSLGDDKSTTFQEFWELGVRMCCRVGDMDDAQRAVDRLLAKQLNPRILMPVIRTLAETCSPESQARGWQAYRRMRGLLGKDMTLSDYDQVVSYFLTTNQVENSLYAFVDMMSNGAIDMTKHKYMPSVVANKFFLGKWLKRLIGAGDLSGAWSVVNFMRHKGVEAAPIQLNGLIGAWQRSGGADDLAKADELAWDMIESRLAFVHGRESGQDRAEADPGSVAPGAPWPRATLETFCLLAERYHTRGLHDKLLGVWGALREAEICVDAFLMNKLLESQIQADRAREALALYRSLVTDQGVTPDPYTFSALWKTLAANQLLVLAPNTLGHEAAETRRMFAETARFRHVFGPGGMDGQLARKVLHTFRRVQDGDGFVVALVALRHMFDFEPVEALAMELTLGTMRLAWETRPQRRRLLLAKLAMDNDIAAHAPAGPGSRDNDGAPRPDGLYAYLLRRFWQDHQTPALPDVAREMGVWDELAPKLAARQ